MLIIRHEMFVYTLPYRRRVSWFNSSEEEAQFVALRIECDNGAVGIAEAPVKANWTGLSARALMALIDDILVPALVDTDINDAAAVATALAIFPGNQVSKMLLVNACAVASSHASDIPLWRSFGGGSAVELSWCVTRQPPAAMAREAADMVGRHGFRTLKIKGGQGFETDRAAIRSVRAAAGSDITYTVDANNAYRVEEAPDYLKMLADEGINLAEDPVPLVPDAGFSSLVENSPIPILVDGPCVTLDQARQFFDAGARAASVKPGRIGFTEAARIAEAARQAGVSLCSGLFAESALGALISLQYAGALTDTIAPAEQSFHLMMAESVVPDMPPINNGTMCLPNRADLGDMVDWKRLRGG